MVTPDGGIPRRNPTASEAQHLARILEVVPGGIVQMDPEGIIVRANEQAQRFLGLEWDALKHRFIRHFEGRTIHEDGTPCPPEEYPASRCLISGRTEGPTTIGVRQPNGEVRWAIFTALPFPAPGEERMGAVVTFVDITDRRRAEIRTRAQNRLLDTVRMVHFRDDPAATVAVFHEPLASLLELTKSRTGFIASVDPEDDAPEELRLHAVVDERAPDFGSSHPPVPIDALSRSVLTSGVARALENPGMLGGAFRRQRPARAVVLPLVTAGKAVGVVGLADAPTPYDPSTLSDLEPLLAACADLVVALDERRARRKLEAQLAQAERLASVGTLAAAMAHEINNPLAYVLLNLAAFTRQAETLFDALSGIRERLAAGSGKTDGEIRSVIANLADAEARLARIAQHGRDATEGGERVQRIVRDLMTFSRVGEEQRALVDVNAAALAALKMAHHEIKYRARIVRDLGRVDPVLGSDGRLSQVFLNLLLNAARAIEEGRPDDNQITLSTSMSGEEVRIEVRDTGCGIAPEHVERLFEPFFSLRAPGSGSGLGLTVCHNVVRAHGGRIEVESELGVGSRFVVILPRAAQRTTPEPPRSRSTPLAPKRRPRLLLIDDETMVLRVLAQLLSHTYEVEQADGFASAIGLLAQGGAFDVILCDMMMLDGTGVDVHAWVRDHRPELLSRMIFMTGGTFTPKARAFLADVAAHHLVKPFSLRELDELIARMLG